MADENNKSIRDLEDQKNHNIFRIMREIDEQDLNSQYDSCSESDDDDSVSDSDEDRSHQSRLLYYLTPVRSPYPINGKTHVLSTLALARENSFSETDEDEEHRAERNGTNNENARNDVQEQASNDQNTHNDHDAENVQPQENKEGHVSKHGPPVVELESDLEDEPNPRNFRVRGLLRRSDDEDDDEDDDDIQPIKPYYAQSYSSEEDEEVMVVIENKLEEMFLQAKTLEEYEMLRSAYLYDKKTRAMRKKYRAPRLNGPKPGSPKPGSPKPGSPKPGSPKPDQAEAEKETPGCSQKKPEE